MVQTLGQACAVCCGAVAASVCRRLAGGMVVLVSVDLASAFEVHNTGDAEGNLDLCKMWRETS